MFDAFKNMFGFGKNDKEIIGSPIEGEAVLISEVSDPTFGEEILGKGIAIIPSVGKVVAPVDGTVEMVFDTKHAITMTSDSGVEILIHVGLDTVTLQGAPFTTHVEGGQKVKAGDLMLEFDIEAIKAAELDIISPMVICNSGDYKEFTTNVGRPVKVLDEVLTLTKQ